MPKAGAIFIAIFQYIASVINTVILQYIPMAIYFSQGKLISLIGSGFASLWFGMCTSYGGWGGAVMARGVTGAWNSVVGVSKTLATELELVHHDFDNDDNDNDDDSGHEMNGNGNNGSCCREKVGYTQLPQNHDRERQQINEDVSSQPTEEEANKSEVQQRSDEQLETKIVGLVMSMRAWGFLVAPAIAGYLADPLSVRTTGHIEYAAKYQTTQAETIVIFHNALDAYPYLLPNLLGAVLCWSTALAVYVGMPETLSECRSSSLLCKDFCNWVLGRMDMGYTVIFVIFGKRAGEPKTTATQQKSTESNGTYGSIESKINGAEERQCQPTALSSIWSRRNTRYHLLAYWFYSLVIIAIDEAFPLYCISHNNGLHELSESEIGGILSIAGLIFSLAQYKVYTTIVSRWGLHKSLGLGCWLGVMPVIILPLASLFTNIKHGPLIYLSLAMGITKIFQSSFFSSITIATNRTVPSSLRSSMNGFGGMGAGLAKAAGPILVGFWMAYCLSWDDNSIGRDNEMYVPMGSVIAFGGIASLGVLLLAMLPVLQDTGY